MWNPFLYYRDRLKSFVIFHKYKLFFPLSILAILFSPHITITPLIFIPITLAIYLSLRIKSKIYLTILLSIFLMSALSFKSNNMWKDFISRENYIEKTFIKKDGEFKRIEGKIKRIEKFGNKEDEYLFTIEKIFREGKGVKVKIPVILKIKKKEKDEIYPEGAKISLLGKIKRWESLKNSNFVGKFFYFSSRHIFLRVETKSEFISSTSIQKNFGIRNKLLKFLIRKCVNLKNFDLLLALLLGIKSTDYLTFKKFTEAGLYHLLVISGLHLGIIAFIIFFLFNRFLGKKYSMVLSFLMITIYISLINNSPATFRAYVMILSYTFLFLLNRKISPGEIISLSGLILLFINPFYIYSTGFILSFASLYAIFLLFLPINEKFLLPLNISSQYIFSEKFDLNFTESSKNGRKVRFFIEKSHFYFFRKMDKKIFKTISKAILKLIFYLSQFFFISFSVILVLYPISPYFDLSIQPLSLLTSIPATCLMFLILPLLFIAIPLFYIHKNLFLLTIKVSLFFINFLNQIADFKVFRPIIANQLPFTIVILLLIISILFIRKIKNIVFLPFIVIPLILTSNINFAPPQKNFKINIFHTGGINTISITYKNKTFLLFPHDYHNTFLTNQVYLPYLKKIHAKKIYIYVPNLSRYYLNSVEELYRKSTVKGILTFNAKRKNLPIPILKNRKISFKNLIFSFRSPHVISIKYQENKILISFPYKKEMFKPKDCYKLVICNLNILGKINRPVPLFILNNAKFKKNKKHTLQIKEVGEISITFDEKNLKKIWPIYLWKLEKEKIILNKLLNRQ